MRFIIWYVQNHFSWGNSSGLSRILVLEVPRFHGLFPASPLSADIEAGRTLFFLLKCKRRHVNFDSN